MYGKYGPDEQDEDGDFREFEQCLSASYYRILL